MRFKILKYKRVDEEVLTEWSKSWDVYLSEQDEDLLIRGSDPAMLVRVASSPGCCKTDYIASMLRDDFLRQVRENSAYHSRPNTSRFTNATQLARDSGRSDLIKWADLVDNVCDQIQSRDPIDLDAATTLATFLLYGEEQVAKDYELIANDRETHWEFIAKKVDDNRHRQVLYVGKHNRVLTMSPRGILEPSKLFTDEQLQGLMAIESKPQ